jgi:hypothetical protein
MCERAQRKKEEIDFHMNTFARNKKDKSEYFR